MPSPAKVMALPSRRIADVPCRAADEVSGEDRDERRNEHRLEPRPPDEHGGDDAEDGETDRREGAEQADRHGVQRDVDGDAGEDRRQGADGGTEVGGDEEDADEGQDSPGQKGAVGARSHRSSLGRARRSTGPSAPA